MIHQYKNTKIHYETHLDGDGRTFYPEFYRIICENIGAVDILYEFCAGPAFIGFSLLEDKMCKKLVLSDIESESIKSCRETIIENQLEKKTLLYQSDCLKQIPPQELDLVVGNPPHFSEPQTNLPQKTIINLDRNWDIHRRFYRDIGKYLKQDSSILFVENGRGSCPEIFYDMIGEGGLKVVDIFKCNLNRPSKFYFMWVKKN